MRKLILLASMGFVMPVYGADRGVAVLHGTQGHSDVGGTVMFVQKGTKVGLNGKIHGLKPNQKHGFHIHEFGDCSSPDAKSAGDHYNPEKHPHAVPPQAPRHAGDFGNLQADARGEALVSLVIDSISLSGSRNSILGRAVVVHADPDKGTQPAGDSGSRIACGVIGIAGKSK